MGKQYAGNRSIYVVNSPANQYVHQSMAATYTNKRNNSKQHGYFQCDLSPTIGGSKISHLVDQETNKWVQGACSRCVRTSRDQQIGTREHGADV